MPVPSTRANSPLGQISWETVAAYFDRVADAIIALRRRPNPYDVLGLPRDAPDAEVKARYRQLFLQHHPDKKGGDGKVFKRLKDAKEEILGN